MLDLDIVLLQCTCQFHLIGLHFIHIPLCALVQIAMDNKEAILGSIPAEHKEEGAKLYTSLLEEKVTKKC